MNTKTNEKECMDDTCALYLKKIAETKAAYAKAADEAARRSVDDAALPDGVDGDKGSGGHGGGGGHGAPPVAVLGNVGDKVALYSMKYHRQKNLLPDKLDNRGNLVSLAPMDDWARFLFGDKEEPSELAIRRAAQDWICAEAGDKTFDPSSIRGRGVWKDEDSDGVVYNAGQACFLVRPDGGFEEVSPCRGKLVYSAGAALPKPSGEPLTDEEGVLLVGLFEKRTWEMEGSGELVAGQAVASLLAGIMPFRPHLWVNAPASTGKTYLKNDLAALLGPLALSADGAETTEAGIRQILKDSCLPLLLDEAEAGDSDSGEKSLRKRNELMRMASYGGMVRKGGADGEAKVYSLKSCFTCFSIEHSLSRDSDTSRFLVLKMRKINDNERSSALWAGQEAPRKLTGADGFHGRLLARLLPMAGDILRNVSTLKKHLEGCGADARRAEMFAVLMAGAYALKRRGCVDEACLARAAEVMEAYGKQDSEKESDFARCLDKLLGYKLDSIMGLGVRTVRQACERLYQGGDDAELRDSICSALGAAGMEWRNDAEPESLRVDTSTEHMKRIFKGSQWQSGRGIASVLTEGGARDSAKESISESRYRPAKAGNARRCLLIPKVWIFN